MAARGPAGSAECLPVPPPNNIHTNTHTCAPATCTHAPSHLLTLPFVQRRYADFRQLRGDSDLAPLREDAKFEGLLARFEKKPSALGKLFEGFM